jgi:hypothetical protein
VKKKSLRSRADLPVGVLPAVFTSRYHTVLYRPSQVTLSMPCFKEGEHPRVGMRLALLENRDESSLTDIKSPVFVTGVIVEINGDLVTLKYDKHPHRAISITFSWGSYKVFCVPLTDKREKWARKVRISA